MRMKRIILTSILALAAACSAFAAGDTTVDGVFYRWSASKLAYIAAGWDESDQRAELTILGEVDDYDVTAIDAQAFADNTVLRSVTIGEGITAIGENAFDRCYNLRQVTLPDGLKTIGEEAFAFCTSLSVMVFPASVTDIGSHAFSQCTGVTDVWFMMKTAAELDRFNWWDGRYAAAGEDAHGGMEFNTVDHTTVHVPANTRATYEASGKLEAWLGSIVEDDAYPLWWIVDYGTVGTTYTVSDDLTAVYADRQGALYCKDDNRWLTPDVAREGERNYMVETGFLAARGNVYDQSNWVAVEGLVSPDAFKGYKINGGTITGVLRDKINPVIEVSEAPVKGAAATYVPNTYIPASLMSRTQVGANDGKTYAFVRPKPQEYAKYEWTIYSDNNEFYVPAPEAGVNVHALKGGLKADMTLLENATMPSLQSDGNYPFDAITRRAVPSGSAGAPRAWRVSAYTEGGLSDKFLVMPLHLPTSPVTGIDDVRAVEPSTVTTRYNLLGQPVGKDYRGLVIENGRLLRR